MTSFEARFDLGYYVIYRSRASFCGIVFFETLGRFVEPQGLGVFVSARIRDCNKAQCETRPVLSRQLPEL